MVSKLTLTYDGVTKDIITGDFKMSINKTKFRSSKSHETLRLQYEAYTQESLDFEPVGLEFMTVMQDVDLDAFKSFARLQNAKFRLDITKDDKEYYCYAYMTDDENDYIAPYEWNMYSISFVRTSMFFREKVYNVNIEQASSQVGYPLAYPYQYPDAGNTFSASQIKIYNKGEAQAPISMELWCDDLDPQVGVDIRADFTPNSYRADGLFPDASEVIINSSLPNDFRIVKVLNGVETNVDQKRKFANSRGYLYAPFGESTLYLNNVVKARVVLYECYYNI